MTFNLATVNEAVAEAVADREAIVFRDRRITYRQLTERTRRFANFLIGRGLGTQAEREALADWESGQDHLGIYLYNGNEYLEAMVGAFKARVAPFNVNYRYVDEELVYLLNDAHTKALVYHSSLASHVAAIRDQVPTLEVLIQVNDEPRPLLDGAVEFEAALAGSSPDKPDLDWNPEDLYILYTGGTTGMPKGVLWTQRDILVASLGARRTNGEVIDHLDGFVARAQASHRKTLPAPPFMHGAGHWSSFQAFHTGGTVVIQDEVRRFDAAGVVESIEREGVNILMLVGDAFGRPLVDALRESGATCPTLRNVITGGAIMTAKLKSELIDILPHVNIIDTAGSSETGGQASHTSNAKVGAATGKFKLSPHNAVLNDDMTRILEPGHDGLGWWARAGNIPLGYLGDEDKTRRTFPVVNGVRYSVPGDKVRLLDDNTLELHGRESVTINSGGEKIFAEEVEHAIKHHPDVYDAVVSGRPSERWGNEVVAIVQTRGGRIVTEESLLTECARHIARYKLPKAFVFIDEILRSPNGKADYRWAKEQVAPDPGD
ncbi:MAG: acyl-CoA synthetase [Gammaproteobacteria bacterium]|nr:acyl-CoA synthetase [Gammaproteobacteria bacterium]